MQEKAFDIKWSEVEPGCVLRLVLHKLWLVVLAVLAGVMCTSLVLSSLASSDYRCSTDFAVSARNTSGVSYYNNMTAATEVVAIYSELLQSRFMDDSVNEAGYGKLNGTISAQQMEETCLIKVTVTSPSPRDALLIMQVVLDKYSDLSKYISSTAVLVPLNTPEISVVPTKQYNERYLKTVFGGICGIAVAAALVWISISSGTIQNAEGAKNRIDAHLIATIPHERNSTRRRLPFSRRRRRTNEGRLNILNPNVTFSFVESVHRLAFRLEHEHVKGKKIFLFSSVSEAEGKSTLVANTAISLASRKARVLFIDLDLRRPVQADILNIQVDADRELGNQLFAGRSAKDILNNAVVDLDTGLTVLLSQKSYADKIQFITSPVLAELLLLARDRFDYILLDTPPLGYFSDSELISDFSDGAILVIRQDIVPAPQINDAIDALSAGKAEFLGYVLNDMSYLFASPTTTGSDRYGRYGKYGKYEKTSSKEKSSRSSRSSSHSSSHRSHSSSSSHSSSHSSHGSSHRSEHHSEHHSGQSEQLQSEHSEHESEHTQKE